MTEALPNDLFLASADEDDGPRKVFHYGADKDGDYKKVIWSKPQFAFLNAPETYPLFVGGLGSGKSTTMAGSIYRDVTDNPGADVGAYAPTYDLLKLITIPKLIQFFTEAGLAVDYNKSDFILHVEDHGRVICRSLANPERIVGYETLRGHIDELDTLPTNQAKLAWDRVIARNRQKIRRKWNGRYYNVRNKVSAYTTPEGYRFCYDRWVKKGGEKYGMYRASTFSNKNLPEDYIENLLDTYDAQLVRAYLAGYFVNMETANVYRMFQRKRNHTDVTGPADDSETLHIGFDFNIGMCTASIHVLRDGCLHAFDEIYGAHDTPSLIEYLDQRYPYNPIKAYPDATGTKRSTSNSNANATDIALLRAANFTIVADRRNPAVLDRVNSVNAALCNGKKQVHYFVNTDNCPHIVQTMEQQIVDKNGMPDKDGGLDHMGDNVGYVVNKIFPIVRSTAGFGVSNRVSTRRRAA